MKAELKDPLENIYPDSTVAKRPKQSFILDQARGTIASIHILINELHPEQRLTFSVKRNGQNVTRAGWFKLIDVPLEENTGLESFTTATMSPNPYVIRKSPFRTYDAMQPISKSLKPETETVALRLHLPILRNARPGTQTITIELQQGKVTKSFELKINIYKSTVTPSGKDSLPYTNWLKFERVAERHDLEMWSEPYWRMLKRYAELMAHGRQNTILIPFLNIFDDSPDGPILQRQRLRRIVNIFTKAGVPYIEGGHVGRRAGGWTSEFFNVTYGGRATEPEGHKLLASFCKQLMEEIERNNWQDRWFQHVTDEPTEHNAAEYRILAGIIRKYMPGIPLIDASQDPTLVGAIDIWCPQVQDYQHDRELYEAQRAIGDKVWVYTCCVPGGPWLNRFLDNELLRPVLIGWAVSLYNLDGFLHWGFNQYREDQDPFKMSVLQKWWGSANNLPAGDTHIAYPGQGKPWSGLRLEAHREGMEDYQLLRKLVIKNPKKAELITGKAVRAFDDYTKDLKQFRRIRKSLLVALG
ncbi:MAG: DUF4091 domain-containing protein [Kiritimatiellae bacterium]|nr:DUF4091 domain-containing protein [Kiritimatiellia bacterium]